MRVCLLHVLGMLSFSVVAANAQSDPTRHVGAEGNWSISWGNVQYENTPSSFRASIYRDRIDPCEDIEMLDCQFTRVPIPGSDWKFEYLIPGQSNFFVQSFSSNPAGNQFEIEHAYGLHGHWGGIESLNASGPNTMDGHWRYKDTEGKSVWKRVLPSIAHVEVHNAPNLAHMSSSTAVSDTHLKLVFDPSTPAWSLDQPFPDQRPTVIVRAVGNNLWGFQSAAMQGSTGIQVSRPRLGHNPTGIEYLEFDLTFWPGVRAGRHILNISGTPITLDLELLTGEIKAVATMDAGNSTEHRPMGSSPMRDPTFSQHSLTAEVLDTGSRQFTQVEATFRTEDPLVLQGSTLCQNTVPQVIVCRSESQSKRFGFELAYLVQPGAEKKVVAPQVSMSTRARDPETGIWVDVAHTRKTVFVRNCEAAFRDALLQVTGPDELRNTARRILTPITSLPGKRLYPGPGDDTDGNGALIRKVAPLTDTLASNKGLDSWLLAQSRKTPNVFDRFADLAQQARSYGKCRDAEKLSNQAAVARALLGDLRANRSATQSTYLGVRQMMEYNEKIVAYRLKGFSGSLPKPLQTVLSVGGNSDSPSSDLGLINRIVTEFSHGVVGWAPGEFVGLSSAILQESASLLPGSASSSGIFKAPAVLSIMMITAQVEISIVDLVMLLQLRGSFADITAWMEAGAYIQGLLARYDALDAAFTTELRKIEDAPNICSCQY